MCLSVCLSVTTKTAAYTLFLRGKQGIIGFFVVFLGMFCRVAFAENALFKSYGIICWSLPPSWLPGELSMDKQDSDGFFSTRKVCVVSH